MIEKVFRKLWRGVGDKGLPPGDAMIIPAIAGQRFGARNRVFHRMRGIGAAGDIAGKVLHGDGEQPCAMGGAGGVKLVIYMCHAAISPQPGCGSKRGNVSENHRSGNFLSEIGDYARQLLLNRRADGRIG